MSMTKAVLDTLNELFFEDGYVIMYYTPKLKIEKYIGTYEKLETAKNGLYLLNNKLIKECLRYKGTYKIFKVKYHKFFTDSFIKKEEIK
jgi:hypothetical protein